MDTRQIKRVRLNPCFGLIVLYQHIKFSEDQTQTTAFCMGLRTKILYLQNIVKLLEEKSMVVF